MPLGVSPGKAAGAPSSQETHPDRARIIPLEGGARALVSN
jgi:hypothetical protein